MGKTFRIGSLEEPGTKTLVHFNASPDDPVRDSVFEYVAFVLHAHQHAYEWLWFPRTLPVGDRHLPFAIFAAFAFQMPVGGRRSAVGEQAEGHFKPLKSEPAQVPHSE